MAKIARGYSTYTCVLGVLLICFGTGASIAGWVLGGRVSNLSYSTRGTSSTSSAFTAYWWGGLGYVLPGVLAVVAGCTRNVCVMAFFLVFNILCFISALAASVLVALVLVVWTVIYNLQQSSRCVDYLSNCVCTDFSSDTYRISGSCEVISAIQVTLGALLGMLVLSLFVSFIGLYVTCCALCHQEPDPVVIITQPGGAYQPPVTVVTNTNMNAGFSAYPLNQQPGYPMNPQPGYPVNPQPGYPVNPQPGYPVNPQPGYPVNPNAGYPPPPVYSPEVAIHDKAVLLKNQNN